MGVALVLISIDWRILSPTLTQSRPLLPINDTEDKLMIPKPNLTFGYRHTNIQACKAIAELNPFSMPVVCPSGLIFLSFAFGNKGLESIPYSVLQNHLNAAHMLQSSHQNFCTLRSHAGGPDWEARLYGRTTVLTASLLKDKIGICGHWVGQGHKYHSCALKTWSTEYGDYAGIRYSCRMFAVREKG